jgi:hypothetical protein
MSNCDNDLRPQVGLPTVSRARNKSYLLKLSDFQRRDDRDTAVSAVLATGKCE